MVGGGATTGPKAALAGVMLHAPFAVPVRNDVEDWQAVTRENTEAQQR